MSDPGPTIPEPAPRAGGERRRLDRAPGERYGANRPATTGGPGRPGSDPEARGRTTRAIVAGVAVAGAGTALFFLVGLVDLGAGLLVVAAFAGWTVALALVWRGREAIADRRTRVTAAVVLGGCAIVAAIILDWAYALAQGGVLGPLDYVAERYGAVAPLAILLAAAVAGIRVR